MSDLFTNKKVQLVASFLFAILILFGFFRACTENDEDSRRPYQIARDLNWSPLQLMGKEKNMRGFSDELLFGIAAEERLRLEIFSVPSRSLLDELDANNYDAILALVTPSITLEQKYLLSSPFFLTGPVLVVSASSDVSSLHEMEGKVVGIVSGSSSVFTVDIYPEILIVTYDNALKGLEELDRNRIDGFIMSAWEAYVYTKGFYSGRLRVATPPLTNEGLRVVAKKNLRNRHLIKRFDTGLETFIKNGEYQKLLDKWGIINTDPQLEK